MTANDQLFDDLERSLTWRSETRRMYEHVVATPRLLASVPAADVCAGHPRRHARRAVPRHAIPKVAHASGPRIAVMFRPDWRY